MNKVITLFGLSIFLCACSSHHNGASISGLTPSDAQKMSSQNAKITEAPIPALNANTRFAAGQLDEAQGNLSDAIRQYNAALDINSKHLPALYQLGVIYAVQKDYDKSLEIWKRYVAASGDAGYAYGNLGYCYELAGSPKLAEAAYQNGIAKDSNNVPCRSNYGLFLAHQNKIQEAVRMWTPVLTEAQIHYNLASIYQQDGRKAEAKAEYQKALACDPTLIDARARLAALETE
ncbi:MAG: tetratricopeptide repeat protein [Tepidisphaeraceae bacterium]|jgi:tetratricopeptide (TPR) repeat protein